MAFSPNKKGQSAIEYLTTYGWMLLVVAIIGGSIFTTIQNQSSIQTNSKFSNRHIDVTDIAITEKTLQIELQSTTTDPITIQKIKLTNTDNTSLKTTNNTPTTIPLGQPQTIKLQNIEKTNTKNTYNLTITYNINTLTNLQTTGTITTPLKILTTVSIAWSSADDWNTATTEDSVVHENTQHTDYDNASNVRLGYSPSDPLYNNSLVAYYPLQEDSGSTAYDFSGNNNDGTINGSTVNQTGLLGTSAYSFDGTGDYIDIPSSPDVVTQLPMSLSAWVNIDTLPSNKGNDERILSKWPGGNTGYLLQAEQNYDHFRFVIHDGSNIHEVNGSGLNAINTGEWYHIVGVAYSDGNMRLYVNGDMIDENTNTFSIGSTTSTNLVIGRYSSSSSSKSWDGKIADVRVYNRSLSASEVGRLYNVTKGHIQPKTKTFSTAVKPDSKASADLNGQDINVTVVGSPSTTAPESHTVTLNGSGGPYSIPWANSHTEFEVNASLSTSNITDTPILKSLS
ncbi:MAG: LamG domain-containing protein, partial [Candidatus Nanohalobium sp.]